MKLNPHDHLKGLSPREKAELNLGLFADFAYANGYSSPQIIQARLGLQSTGWLRRAEARGDIAMLKTGSGSPPRICLLTPKTLALAEQRTKRVWPYPEIDFACVNQSLIRHNLYFQDVSLRAESTGLVAATLTERQLAGGDRRGVKRPDGAWSMKSGQIVAIEIELTAKWGRHFDEFVSAIVAALDDREGPPAFDRFAVVSDSKALLERYIAALVAGEPMNTWRKNERGMWIIDKRGHVPKWVSERVSFRFARASF